MFIFNSNKAFAQCHASTLTIMPNGNFMSAWFGGTRERHEDTGIWGSFMSDGVWSEPILLAKMNNEPHWNPVLFTTKGGKTFLFFKTGKSPTEWITWISEIKNNLVDESSIDVMKFDDSDLPRGPVRCKPIELSNGDWVAPSSIEEFIGYTCDGKAVVRWSSFMDYSRDCGQTWTASNLIDFDRGVFGAYGGIIQPTIWESPTTGYIHALMRSTAGKIFRSDSSDYGRTWCDAYPIDLPNNNSGVDAVIHDDILFLIYNPISDNWGVRTPLSINYSFDEGHTWLQEPIHIKNQLLGSFSYPAMIATSDGLATTYTWNRKRISFREFTINHVDCEQIELIEKKY